jgi:hypothetical protein
MVVQGKVVGHEAREIDDTKSYLPVVIFHDQTGTEFRFTSVAGRSTRQPEIGAEVPVRYLPSDPRIAYVGTFLYMWAAPLGTMVLGLAGIAALWVS